MDPKHCCICGESGAPATKFVRVGPFELSFCEQDYQMSRQLLENLANIRQLLHLSGIHIGVPKDIKIKGITP